MNQHANHKMNTKSSTDKVQTLAWVDLSISPHFIAKLIVVFVCSLILLAHTIQSVNFKATKPWKERDTANRKTSFTGHYSATMKKFYIHLSKI